jgi:hypothetical protein
MMPGIIGGILPTPDRKTVGDAEPGALTILWWGPDFAGRPQAARAGALPDSLEVPDENSDGALPAHGLLHSRNWIRASWRMRP